MNKYKKWEGMISNTADKQTKNLFFKQPDNLTKEIMGQFGNIRVLSLHEAVFCIRIRPRIQNFLASGRVQSVFDFIHIL
jgi:hypothetical protein